jgi:hypothetical protein
MHGRRLCPAPRAGIRIHYGFETGNVVSGNPERGSEANPMHIAIRTETMRA